MGVLGTRADGGRKGWDGVRGGAGRGAGANVDVCLVKAEGAAGREVGSVKAGVLCGDLRDEGVGERSRDLAA